VIATAGIPWCAAIAASSAGRSSDDPNEYALRL
jgi:hypothetical protein